MKSKFLMIETQPAIRFIIFWDFLMFHQIFLSAQVKRCVIITYINTSCHDLPKDLRLRKLSKLDRMIA